MGYFNIILLCYFYGSTNAVYRWAQPPTIVDCTSHLCGRMSATGFHTRVTPASPGRSPSRSLVITAGAPALCRGLKAAEALQDYSVASLRRCRNGGPERVGDFSGAHTANVRQSCVENSGSLTRPVSPLPSFSLCGTGFPVHLPSTLIQIKI